MMQTRYREWCWGAIPLQSVTESQNLTELDRGNRRDVEHDMVLRQFTEGLLIARP